MTRHCSQLNLFVKNHYAKLFINNNKINETRLFNDDRMGKITGGCDV